MTGDANADVFATGLDFLTWQQQFGNTGGVPLAAATAIPEPTSVGLLLFGAVLILRPRHSKS